MQAIFFRSIFTCLIIGWAKPKTIGRKSALIMFSKKENWSTQPKIQIWSAPKTQINLVLLLFLGRLGSQGSTENFCNSSILLAFWVYFHDQNRNKIKGSVHLNFCNKKSSNMKVKNCQFCLLSNYYQQATKGRSIQPKLKVFAIQPSAVFKINNWTSVLS